MFLFSCFPEGAPIANTAIVDLQEDISQTKQFIRRMDDDVSKMADNLRQLSRDVKTIYTLLSRSLLNSPDMQIENENSEDIENSCRTYEPLAPHPVNSGECPERQTQTRTSFHESECNASSCPGSVSCNCLKIGIRETETAGDDDPRVVRQCSDAVGSKGLHQRLHKFVKSCSMNVHETHEQSRDISGDSGIEQSREIAGGTGIEQSRDLAGDSGIEQSRKIAGGTGIEQSRDLAGDSGIDMDRDTELNIVRSTLMITDL